MPVTTVLLGLFFESDDLDFFADLHLTALDAARADRTAAGDREDVFDRHQERLVDLSGPARECNSSTVSISLKIGSASASPLLPLDWSALRAEPRMIGVLSPSNSYLREQLADFHLDQLEQLFVVDQVDFIQEHDDARNADLAHEQNVLARLRHRAVGRGDDQDRAVHLRGAGDHVLDVVGVTGAVDVRVVALRRSRTLGARWRS